MPIYQAIRYRQHPEAKPVILFVAPCHEILNWGGIPQKKIENSLETLGFQRTDNPSRLKSIADFLSSEAKNILPNPILCATKDCRKVAFTPSRPEDDPVRGQPGVLEITTRDFSEIPYLDLVKEAVAMLQARSAKLKELRIEPSQVDSAIHRLRGGGESRTSDGEGQLGDVDTEADPASEEEADTVDVEVSFDTESHVHDFYRALLLRLALCERLGISDKDSVLGLSKSVLIEYLKPTMVVDGQHRLLGANRELTSLLESTEGRDYADSLADQGAIKEQVRAKAEERFARRLGVSLIHDDDWSEHVFQFVVVNQKATPIPKALLASIVATTLTEDEISRISARLVSAGIPVTDYVAINYLNAARDSPFYGLINRGIGKGTSERLINLTVVDKLIKMVRDFKGATLFHDTTDWAAYFLKKGFESRFDFLPQYLGLKERLRYWQKVDGPWREFFCRFFSKIRELFSTEDEQSGACWGYPRKSNLFNGVHLQILLADFFRYLYESKDVLHSLEQLDGVIEKGWLENVYGKTANYFARTWRPENSRAKKTDAAVQRAWSVAWTDFRNHPEGRLPRIENYYPKPTK